MVIYWALVDFMGISRAELSSFKPCGVIKRGRKIIELKRGIDQLAIFDDRMVK